MLYPGWNMVGWVGPSTPTSELFDAIPALRQVSAWDAEVQAYQHAPRRRYSDLPTLTPGMGLWLRLGGDSTVEWTQLVAHGGVAVRLEEGVNLVAVASDGGVSFLGAEVRVARRWDPVRQRYETYRFGDETLRRGDALRIQMSSAANWWQPGTPDQPLVFVGAIPAETRTAIVEEYDRIRAFFAERFGILTPGPLQYIGADANALRWVYGAVFDGGELRGSLCAQGDSGRAYVRVLRCTYPSEPFSMVDEFTHNLVLRLPDRDWNWRGVLPLDPRGPEWLTEGIRRYTVAAYHGSDGQPDVATQRRTNGDARRMNFPLSHFEVREVRNGVIVHTNEEDALSFLAAQWLADHAGKPALFDYYRQVRFPADWREAFASAFGVSVEHFYEQFAAHRAEAFPPLPHLADDKAEPVLVVLDGVPADTTTAVQTELRNVRQFFADRFEAEATEFTLYVAPDSETAFAAAPGWHGGNDCHVAPSRGLAVLPLDLCDYSWYLHQIYFAGVRGELAYRQPLAPSVTTFGWAPAWFDKGVELLSQATYATDTRGEPYGTYRDAALSAVEGNPTHLERIETPSDARAVGPYFAWNIGFLAVEWLANHAGDPALFDYYRRLPEATSRDEAFEGAFGLTLEEFYEQFEAYRATLETP